MKVVRTDRAPGAIGPYSQAIVANGFVFCSGQVALDPATGTVEYFQQHFRPVLQREIDVKSP